MNIGIGIGTGGAAALSLTSDVPLARMNNARARVGRSLPSPSGVGD